jgi:transposase-like protein
MGRHRTATETVELGEQARAMRAAGKSRREIVAAIGMGEDLLDELLRGTEVPDALRRPRAKDDQRALAREMYAAGQSYREIERELGVARSSLSLWLRDLKADTLKRHNPKTVRKNVGEAYVGCLSIGVRQSRELYQRMAGTWQGIMAGVAAAVVAAA